MAEQSLLTLMRQSPDEAKRRLEFYELVQEGNKAEFINGEMIFHSPVKKRHWSAGTKLSSLLTVHAIQHNLGDVGAEKVMIRLTRNDYEPDVVFFKKEKADQQEQDQMLFSAPDFVVEILSPSTEENDRGIKWQDYAAHGIPEYWIIDPEAQTIEQYLLPEGESRYTLAKKVGEGDTLTAQEVPGFTLKVASIFG